MTTQHAWIADGTAEAEPVTVETPIEAVETAAPVDVTEAVEAVEAAGGDVTPESVADAIEYLEARRGDEVYQLPQDVRVPIQRGGATEYVPIGEALKDAMKGNDYRLKTTELADMRRETQRRDDDIARREARADARHQLQEERAAELKAAFTDPKSAAAYEEHLVQYQNNPIYRKNVDTALSATDIEADRNALREREDSRIVNEASNLVFGWIETLGAEYEGVDQERVRETYARQLSAGQAQLDINAVRSIYKAESDYVNRTVSPLRDELAGIRAQLKALQSGTAATQHNATTEHAVKRAQSPPIARGPGAPGTTRVAPTKFAPNELQERNSEWAKIR